jgi:hypothetical protein
LFNFISYIFFSMVETASFFVFMQYIFRFRPRPYLRESLIVSLVVSVLSFLIREELNIKDYFPFIVLAVFILYVKFVMRVTLFWAILMATISYVLFLIIQAGIVLAYISIRGIALEDIQKISIDQFIGQTITGSILYGISMLLFKKGYGFSFSFEKFRFRGEDILVSIIVVVTFGAIGILFFLNNLLVATAVLLILAAVLLYYGLRKERSYDFKTGA